MLAMQLLRQGQSARLLHAVILTLIALSHTVLSISSFDRSAEDSKHQEEFFPPSEVSSWETSMASLGLKHLVYSDCDRIHAGAWTSAARIYLPHWIGLNSAKMQS